MGLLCGCGCGTEFQPRVGGRPQRFAPGHRLNFWKRARTAGAMAITKVKAVRARRPRLGSKERPLIAVQCPKCRIIYTRQDAQVVESADGLWIINAASRCRFCEKEEPRPAENGFSLPRWSDATVTVFDTIGTAVAPVMAPLLDVGPSWPVAIGATVSEGSII